MRNLFHRKESDLSKLTWVFSGRAGTRLHTLLLSWLSPTLHCHQIFACDLRDFCPFPLPHTWRCVISEYQAPLPFTAFVLYSLLWPIPCRVFLLSLFFPLSVFTCVYFVFFFFFFWPCLALRSKCYNFDSAPDLWLVEIPFPVLPGL